MTERTISEQAEELSRRRARILPVLAIIYIGQQASFFASVPADPTRVVDHVKIGAWAVLSLVLLALLTTKGFWFRSAEVRDVLDDESTRANRVDALGWGFVLAILSAISLFILSIVGRISARESIHVIVSIGIVTAIIRFALLERRGYRDA